MIDRAPLGPTLLSNPPPNGPQGAEEKASKTSFWRKTGVPPPAFLSPSANALPSGPRTRQHPLCRRFGVGGRLQHALLSLMQKSARTQFWKIGTKPMGRNSTNRRMCGALEMTAKRLSAQHLGNGSTETSLHHWLGTAVTRANVSPPTSCRVSQGTLPGLGAFLRRRHRDPLRRRAPAHQAFMAGCVIVPPARVTSSALCSQRRLCTNGNPPSWTPASPRP